MQRSLLAILILLAPATLRVVAEDRELTLERDVRPILKEHCLECHGATNEMKGELDLRLARFMIAGGESGPAIVPGKAGESLLLQRVRDGEMPPGDTPVPAEQIAILEKWISGGAATARPEPETIEDGIGITFEEREFWSFKPVVRPAVPKFDAADRARTPVDAFLLESMKTKASELSFSPDANRRTMIRRLYLDLIGLPPTPDDVSAFVADKSPQAYEALVDRLLKSPRYGERWARHWLDIAGYADSEGYSNADADRPWAYQYRDYVIRSLNADKPFDQFIQEQLAGDEMAPRPHANLSPNQIDKLTATGLLRMAADGTGSGSNDDTARNQTVADTIKIVSTSLLGLSVGCAQCHDHRYDPIPQKDYYALRAVFEPALDWKRWRTPPQRLLSLYTDDDRAKAKEVEAEVAVVAAEKAKKLAKYIDEALEKELGKHATELRERLRTAYKTPATKRNDEQKKLLKEYPSTNISAGNLYQYNKGHADELKAIDANIAKIRTKKPVEKFLRVLTETSGKAPQTFLFHRGDHRQPTEPIAPAGLSIAAPPGERATFEDDEQTKADGKQATSGRRLAYAKSLTNSKHPLVARVLVNRIWLHHFGRGIVGTPSDFGRLGQRPTHPKLLDWLASEFVEKGWSLKRLHKLIVMSTAYRQSSVASPEKLAIDGANRHYWKWPLQRLDAEIVRDRILATNGALGDEMYGPAVNVKTDDAGQVLVDGGESRRSIYIRVKRTQPVAMLKAFDAPVMDVNCESRPSSTVAPQSLLLMNSEFILRQARALAKRAADEAKTSVQVDFDLTQLQPAESSWSFGYGRIDDDAKSVDDFTPLPHWNGNTWQGGPKLPDPKLSFAFLNATGGHPSNELAVIRRWTAPESGKLTITGQIAHPSKNGDGVRGRIISSRHGVAGTWVAQGNSAATEVKPIEIERGDRIDFVVDCRANMTSDSFSWEANLSMSSTPGATMAVNSKVGFHGPVADGSSTPAQILRAWELAYCRPPSDNELTASLQFLADQVKHINSTGSADPKTSPSQQAMANLCQVLLSSNEFLYID